jgi:hypothetical protein
MIPYGELLSLFEVHAIVKKKKVEQQMNGLVLKNRRVFPVFFA